MQVNSITSFSANCQPRRLMNNTPQPEPTPVSNPQPETSEEKKASIYFRGNEKEGNTGKSLRKAGMIMLLVPVLGGITASCQKDEPYAYAEAHNDGWAYAYAKSDRDTVYRDITKFDTVYVDTGSYHVSHDTIIKWRDNYVRPIPLDSIMKSFHNWGIDGTGGADIFNGKTNRNIIHYVGTREWEYNNREIGDMDVVNSSKYNLIYDTDIQDYKGKHIRYGKTIFRIPTAQFTLKTPDGRIINSPKGYFAEFYSSPSKGADILDCTREKQFFCQTDANNNVIKVYSKDDEGNFVEDGSASKGYLATSSVLFKNLIGRYDTDDHFVDFHVTAVNDETLKDLYVRKMDDLYAKENE